ncbi:protein tyrosine kinase domain-containing protein [Rhizoctonia solani AG-1 IA]|uniref:Protein tyrosine kinase domain-containing protein n=1 Tax=Thanatephorus cucumeris (strain AG1-IA) TaxID=983506 RepID=L8WE33_THACA|nr:protein tyrosine kinase domain-containing protein [Rhizoctonia solani AG-1 IA]
MRARADSGVEMDEAQKMSKLVPVRNVQLVRPSEMVWFTMLSIPYGGRQVVLLMLIDIDSAANVTVSGRSWLPVAEGAFGDVYKRRLNDGTNVAIKALRYALVKEDGGAKRAMMEIYYWSKLNHKNVSKLLGITMLEERLAMVSEWMENGTLNQYLKKNPTINRYELCLQVTDGLIYLHGKDMAPEIARGQDKSKQSDVYALGMTLFVSRSDASCIICQTPRQEIITSLLPYPECRGDAQVVFKLHTGTLPARPMEYFADNDQGNILWSILSRCWDHNPMIRPSANNVLESFGYSRLT